MPRANSPLTGRVIFVVGARRSGTNWLQRILTASKEVVAMPSETYLFSGGIDVLVGRFQHVTPGLPKTGLTFMPRETLLDALRDLVDRVFEENSRVVASRAKYVVERTPWHAYNLGLIADIYPDARIIHIVRDGRDVARSLLAQEWGPGTIEAAAEEWRSSVAAARAAGASLPGYSEVSYERLLTDPRVAIKSLYEELGLEPTAEVLHRAALEANTAFNVDPRSPSIRSGKWEAGLSTTQLRAFNRTAGPLLEELGYEVKVPSHPSARRAFVAGASWVRRHAQQVVRPKATVHKSLARIRARRRSETYERRARALQRLLSERGDARRSMLRGMLTPTARIDVVDDDNRWSGRGTEGGARLAALLEAHDQRGVHPLSGEVLPSSEMFTVVGTYRMSDGSVWTRTLVVTFRGLRLGGIGLYRYPVTPTSSHRAAAGPDVRREEGFG